jgi:hypothetical protein
MKIIFTILLFIMVCGASFGQDTTDVKIYTPQYFKEHQDSLCAYSANKKVMPNLEVQALIALSHYPELKSTRITFVEKNIRTTAACRPTWTFLFKSRKNRAYKIYINNDIQNMKGALLEEVPFDAQIGLIGHELGHVADYSNRSAFTIIGMAFSYLFISGKSKIEHRVDRITIAHHLGWQLYNFEDFIFYKSTVSKEYKEYKRKVYLAPEKLKKLIGARGKQ